MVIDKIGQRKCFQLKKANDTSPWKFEKEDLYGKIFFETSYEQELQTTKQTVFRIEKVIKKKGDKM